MEGHTLTQEGRTEDTLAKKLYSIGQYILAIVFGLLPILFLPLEGVSVLYLKVVLVIVSLLVVVILFSFSVLRSGVLKFSFPLPLCGLWLIAIFSLISTLLSNDFRDGFFGESIDSQTTLFLFVLALISTFAMQLLNTKSSVMRLYVLLSAGTLLLAAFHILRLFVAPSTLSLGMFGDSRIATPIGSWNDLAIFFGLAILISLVALEQLSLTKMGKGLFGGVVVVALIMLAVINFSPVWFVLAIVGLVVLIYALAKDRFSAKWLEGTRTKNISGFSIAISGLVFTVSALFVIGGSMLGGYISNLTGVSYIEVRPSFEATAGIARSVYENDALFGIGTNRFSDAWRLFKDPALNGTIFWNTDFFAGVGYVPTFFVTTGILGGLLWLGFLGLFFYSGLKTLLRVQNPDHIWYFILTSAFTTAVYLWGVAVIYVPGSTLIMLAAVCTGLVFAAQNALEPGRVRVLSLLGSRNSGFVLVSVTMLVVLGSVSALYSTGRHFMATKTFAQSVSALSDGSLDEGEVLAANAYELSRDDRYARSVAEIQFVRLVSLLGETNPSADVQTRFQSALVNGVQSARAATDLDPSDPNNWAILGSIYAAVVPLKIEGAYEEAQKALEQARALDPVNPLRTLALARLATQSGDQEMARTLVSDAIRLKNDYTDAIFYLAQLDVERGDIAAAIASTQTTIMLEPQNPVRYFQLGILLLAQNKNAEAAAAFEKAVSLQSDYSNAYYYLAFAYDRIGRDEEALMAMNKVLSYNPGNTEVMNLISALERGENIASQGFSGNESTPPIEEETTTEETPVESEDVPEDSSLLSPVNAVPETPEEEVE